MNAPVVCSIGCTDPWNAAGLGLDIRVLAACGVRPVTVVAGVSAQDRRGVHAAKPIPAELVAAQLAALDDAGIAAYRIGALLDVATVETIAKHLAHVRVPVIYDPVLAPSGGGGFVDSATLGTIVRALLPLATVVTPNLSEAERLCGFSVIEDELGMERAGHALLELGARAALLKGGHLAGDPFDLLVEPGGTRAYRASRLSGTLRGTGCVLACGIAAALAGGVGLHDAIDRARGLVRERFAAAQAVGGMRLAY